MRARRITSLCFCWLLSNTGFLIFSSISISVSFPYLSPGKLGQSWLLLSLPANFCAARVTEPLTTRSGLDVEGSFATKKGLLRSRVRRDAGPLVEKDRENNVELVDQLLEKIDISKTARGISATAADKKEIMDLVLKLEASGTRADADFLSDKSAYGNYEVAYVGASSSRIANPAGGRWRGRVGRFVCPTRGLYQHIIDNASKSKDAGIEGDTDHKQDGGNKSETGSGDAMAVNLLQVALLGLLPITVVLHGPAFQLSAAERNDVVAERGTPGGLSKNSVRANFEAPRIAIGSCGQGLARYIPKLRLTVGPKSSVVLDAPYVDDRIRIGKGASGIYFVFRRAAANDDRANAWQHVLDGPALGAKGVGKAFSAAGVVALATKLLQIRDFAALTGASTIWPWVRIAASFAPAVSLIAMGFFLGRSSGGIVRGQPRNADYKGQGFSAADAPS